MLRLAALVVLALAAAASAAPEREIKQISVQNGVECALCEFVMKELDGLITKNSTEAEIEAALDKVCGYLPKTLQGACDNLVQKYTPEIVQYLVNGLNPDQICAKIGLCKNSTLTFTLPPQAFRDRVVDSISGNGVECALCEFVMKELDGLITKNSTEAEIEAALDKVCGYLPKTLQGACDNLVQKYTPEIVQYLVNGLNPDQICTKIGLCKNSTSTSMVIVHETKPVKVEGVECALCEFVMKELDSLIGENATIQEIEAALDKVCGYLPKSLQSSCAAFVETYSPQIIKLLLEHLDPQQICTDLGLCSSPALPKMNPFVQGKLVRQH